jgi:two-component system OmpR family response regulator
MRTSFRSQSRPANPAEESMRVLLVEDDRMIGAAVQQALSDAAYAVDWTTDGQQALAASLAQAYDVVLLDLGLPLRDGIDVLRQLRARNAHVPILIVTARDEVEDRIAGLDLGADDYVLKPFDVHELLARMRAVVRRQGGSASPLLTNGAITLDPVTRDVSFEGQSAALSGREFTLLQALLVRPGAILSRQELEERIYGWNEEIESNTVEVLIHGIRRKLGPTVIRNVRGVGWRVDRAA